MAEEEFLTRCPQCSTLFTLSSHQLKLANGNVRCGACLSIFNAKLYITKDKPEQRVTDLPSPSNSTIAPDQDWINALNNDLEASYQSLGQILEPYSQEQKQTLADELTTPASDPDTLHANQSRPSESEKLWSQNILQELEKQSNTIASNIQQAISAQQTPEQTQQPVQPASPSLKDLALLPLREESPTSDTQITAPAHTKTKPKNTVKPKQTPAPSKAVDQPRERNHTNKTKHYEALALSEFDTLTKEALESKAPNKHTLTKTFLWGSLCFIGSLLFIAQYSYFNFSELAQDTRFRPALRFSCLWLNCDLPVYQKREALKTTQLIIRQHPNTQGILIADLKIVNEAPYPQGFPDLELIFTDINEKVTAVRRFTPDQYRSAALKRLPLMPPNQPLHITLDTQDPGQSTVNYRLALY